MARKEEATLLLKIKQQGTGKLKDIKNAFKSIKKAALGIVTAVGGATLAIGHFALMSDKFDGVKKAFKNMVENQGKDAETFLKKMKETSKGTVSELELMQKANTALLLGLPIDKFGEMLTIARSASKATGESMDFMLNSIVVGLGRGSKLMLDNLGIVFKLEDAYEDYAKELNTTAAKLTEIQKKQAFINEAMRVGTANSKKMGDVSDSLNDTWQRTKANATNLSVAIGDKLQPAMKAILFVANKTMSAFSTLFKDSEPAISGSTQKIKELREEMAMVYDDSRRSLLSFLGLAEKGEVKLNMLQRLRVAAIEKEIKKEEATIVQIKKKEEAKKASIALIAETHRKVVEAEKMSLEEMNALELQSLEDVMKAEEGKAKTLNSMRSNEMKEEIKNAQDKNDELNRIETERVDKMREASAKVIEFTKTGVQGIASSAVSMLTDKLIPGLGGAAGELFNVLSQDAETFQKTMDQMFSPAFIQNFAENLGTLIDNLPKALPSIVEALIGALPELAVSVSKMFLSPKFIIDMATGLAKAVFNGLITAIPQLAAGFINMILAPINKILGVFGIDKIEIKAKGVKTAGAGVEVPGGGGGVSSGDGGPPETEAIRKSRSGNALGLLMEYYGKNKKGGFGQKGKGTSGIADTFVDDLLSSFMPVDNFQDLGPTGDLISREDSVSGLIERIEAAKKRRMDFLRDLLHFGTGDFTNSFAAGGIVRAQAGGMPAIVGEGGQDEAIIPLENGRIPGGGGGTNINITVNGGLLGDETSARELALAIDGELLKLRQDNQSLAFDQGVI